MNENRVNQNNILFESIPTVAGNVELYHHHHHVVPLARISLTLSRHFSLSFIASGRSPGLHPVSSHSCCMYVRAGRPAFDRLYLGVHRSTSLMSSSSASPAVSSVKCICILKINIILMVCSSQIVY